MSTQLCIFDYFGNEQIVVIVWLIEIFNAEPINLTPKKKRFYDILEVRKVIDKINCSVLDRLTLFRKF